MAISSISVRPFCARASSASFRATRPYFSRVIDYVADDQSVDVDIAILENQQMKNCSFDSFHSKTGGKFCVVTVAELLAEFFGKADGVSFD
jgi:hypothetical protein